MNLIKSSIRVCMQKFRLSLTDIRVWMALVIVAIFIFTYEKDIFDYAQGINAEVTPWLFPFLNGQKFIRIILLLGPVLFFCNCTLRKFIKYLYGYKSRKKYFDNR